MKIRLFGLVVLLVLLVLLVACDNPGDREVTDHVGKLWVRSKYYDHVTVETEQGYISVWDMCSPYLVWEGMHADITFHKDHDSFPCWQATVLHMPPDVEACPNPKATGESNGKAQPSK